MIVYSHRGNLKGPNDKYENHPAYIDEAIQEGLPVEIDLRWSDENFFLGHDFAQYKIDKEWLFARKENILIHCKEISPILNLSNFHFFCHSNDDFVITSNGYIWIHNLNIILNSSRVIIPLMITDLIQTHCQIKSVFSICTDFPIYLKSKKYKK